MWIELIFTVCPLTQTGPGCLQCLPGFTGQDCQKCELGFYDFPSCKGFSFSFLFCIFMQSILENLRNRLCIDKKAKGNIRTLFL